MERILISLLYIALGATTGIQKLSGEFPPTWFTEKFSGTIIGMIPGGLPVSYVIIVLLEIIIALLFSFSLIKKEFRSGTENTFSIMGFYAALILFLILFFGSFLARDYDNGFSDFVYFGVTVYLMNLYLKGKKV